MLYASTNYGKRRAEKGLDAWCPGCNAELIPKCGEILIHHWAHKQDMGCDWDAGKMSAWHMEWQSHFPPEQVEVRVGNNRADIITDKGVIIELQHSAIAKETIREREQIYPKMVWIIDASEFRQNITIREHIFSWAWARKTWEDAEKKILLDYCNGVVFVIQEWIDQPQSGYAYFVKKAEVLNWMKTGQVWEIPGWARYSAAERGSWAVNQRRERSELLSNKPDEQRTERRVEILRRSRIYDPNSNFDYSEWMKGREQSDQEHADIQQDRRTRMMAAAIGRWHYERKIRAMYKRWCEKVLP